MLKYVIKRLCGAVINFFIILTLTFLIIKALPTAPPRDVQEAAIRQALGYNRPVIVQYGIYLRNIFTEWNWGVSLNIQWLEPVWDVVVLRLPPTIIINVLSLSIAIPIGMVLGFYAAMRKNKWQDNAISTIVVLFISVPSFIYAFLVLLVLCAEFNWFPTQVLALSEVGYNWLDPRMLHSMMPVVIAISLGIIAGMTRSTRAEICDAMTSDYVLLARTKGLTRGQAVWKHALKNAMVPIFPGIVSAILGVMGGSMIIENIFGVPGIGRLSYNSMGGGVIGQPDYDVFMFLQMFFLAVGLLSGIIVDLSRGFLDPRIRMGSRKAGV